MKITSFNPLILTKDPDAAIKLFEALGFEKRHSITFNEKGKDITSVRMKDSGGFAVDIAKVDVPQDITLIRMNVDNFEEAFELLTAKGFTKPENTSFVETKTNKSCMMCSPTGFAFDLCQHIKE